MILESFSALDFETATWNPASVCQIGIVRYEKGSIVTQVNELIQPPRNEYFYKNIEVHGIQPNDTKNAPLFDKIWFKVRHLIEDQVIVAHNANFDVNCLRNALAYYDIVQPEFEVRCTRVIYKRGLAYLSKKYKIPLNFYL
ncbi:MAG: 3'-5' exoribonuclease [Ekhidna sp.]|nr:3'-5' exoribonuclease [Ekhidna sp.]